MILNYFSNKSEIKTNMTPFYLIGTLVFALGLVEMKCSIITHIVCLMTKELM